MLEFIRKLRLDNKTIEGVIGHANRATSSRIGDIDKDLRRAKDSLHQLRIKISNVVDVLADKGISQLKPLKEKLERLSEEEQDLVREEKRLEQEINAEKRQAGSAHEQIQTLHLFNDLYALNQDNPERLKMLMPRFIKYVICHFTDRQKGIGRLELGLFGRPFAGSENAEIWNETLKKLAEQCNKQLIADWRKQHSGNNGRKKRTAPTELMPEPCLNQRDDSAAGVVVSPANEFIPGYQMGSVLQRPVNASGVRIFKYTASIYSIFDRRRQQFVFGERPEALGDNGIPDQRDMESYRTYLKRLENFPLKKAEYYRELQESTGIKSVRGLSEITGEDWSFISRILRILELPEPIRNFLKSHSDPSVVKTFHLRRLLELIRLGNENLQFARFREMLDEINSAVSMEKTGGTL